MDIRAKGVDLLPDVIERKVVGYGSPLGGVREFGFDDMQDVLPKVTGISAGTGNSKGIFGDVLIRNASHFLVG